MVAGVPKYRCDKCGRQGERGYTYTIRGVYVCTGKNACAFRQRKANAKAEFKLLPAHRQEALAREFQEAADAALRHARYNRPG